MGLKDILDTLQEWVDENCTDDEHAEASRHIEDFRGMFGLEEE